MTASSAAYQKRWHYDRHRGIRRRIPTPPQLQAHLDTLRRAGWSYRAIAAEAGLTVAVVHRLATQQPATTRPAYAAAILALDPTKIPGKPSRDTTEPFVPNTGTKRRLQALLALGWGYPQLDPLLGTSAASIVHQAGRWVTRTTHDRVAALYDQLQHQRGPSSQAATWAAKKGYALPAEWDDIDTDPRPHRARSAPRVVYVDQVAVERAAAGDYDVAALNRKERRALAVLLAERGDTLAQIADVLGISRASASQLLNYQPRTGRDTDDQETA